MHGIGLAIEQSIVNEVEKSGMAVECISAKIGEGMVAAHRLERGYKIYT